MNNIRRHFLFNKVSKYTTRAENLISLERESPIQVIKAEIDDVAVYSGISILRIVLLLVRRTIRTTLITLTSIMAIRTTTTRTITTNVLVCRGLVLYFLLFVLYNEQNYFKRYRGYRNISFSFLNYD